MSPSAFIPFCGYGSNMSITGVKSSVFDVPVCNIFRPKILNNQICYEVDINDHIDKASIEKELESGFYFFMDYNEDRQVLNKTSPKYEGNIEAYLGKN